MIDMNDSQKELTASLTAAISETMENMTFEEIEVLVDTKKGSSVYQESMWATLPVLRPLAGRIALEIPTSYGKCLTEALAGDSENEVCCEAIGDVLGEIINTIAGRFISRLLPPTEEFELGLPETGQGELAGADEAVTSILLSVGGHCIKTSVSGADFWDFSNSKRRN